MRQRPFPFVGDGGFVGREEFFFLCGGEFGGFRGEVRATRVEETMGEGVEGVGG